ncbi:hypothetical protein HY417_01040 [Candidatus Kaiserbacteria bacterium]|nr:hypothetical protein [Candidatus Kaiserbacteria bacterium]
MTIAIAAIVSGDSSTAASEQLTITRLVLDKPASVAEGDFLLANVTLKRGAGIVVDAPTGWTEILGTDNDDRVSVISYWKVAGGDEPSTYTWSVDGRESMVGGITRYSGVDPNDPIDVAAGAVGNSRTPTAPSITTSEAGEKIVAVFGVDSNASFTPPLGMTEKYDISYGGAGPATSLVDALQASAGATGDKVATTSGSKKRNWAAQQIAIRQFALPPSPPSPPSINGSITTTAINAAVTTDTFSHTINAGTNQLLVVTTSASCGDEDITATFDGVAMTKGAAHGAGTAMYYNYWYLVAPNQGTHDVVITYGACSEIQGRTHAAITFNNVDQAAPINTDGHTGANGGDPALALSPTVENTYLLYFLNYNNNPANLVYAPTDPQLYQVDNTAAGNFYANLGAGRVQAASGLTAVGGTATGNGPWDLIGIAVKPAL